MDFQEVKSQKKTVGICNKLLDCQTMSEIRQCVIELKEVNQWGEQIPVIWLLDGWIITFEVPCCGKGKRTKMVMVGGTQVSLFILIFFSLKFCQQKSRPLDTEFIPTFVRCCFLTIVHRHFGSAVCGPEKENRWRKEMNLYLLNTVVCLKITYNCPLWPLVNGTEKKRENLPENAGVMDKITEKEI